jgi:hypothetical protein
MADQFDKVGDRELASQLRKKNEITLANQAMDDVKVFIQTMLVLLRFMYKEHVEETDYKEMQEDIAKLVLA